MLRRAAFVITLLLASGTASAGGHVVEGVVRDVEGRPVPGATVRLGERWDESRARTVTADDEGRYRFDDVGGGIVELRVAPPGQPATDTAIRLQVPPVSSFDPVVVPGHEVHGRVTDVATDEPLAGARVTVRGDGIHGSFRGVGVTDDEGVYRLVTAANGHSLSATAELAGWTMESSDNVVPDIDRECELDVRMRRLANGTLAGVVRRADGTPVAGVEVHATNLRLSRDQGEWTARTADDGTFRIEHVDAGEVTVLARASGLAQEGDDGSFRAPGGSDDLPGPLLVRVPTDGVAEADVVLHPMVVVRGTVVDEYAIPVAGARVGVPGNLPFLDRVETDASGAFELPVPPGPAVRVFAVADAHEPAFTTVEVARDASPEPLRLELRRHHEVRVHVRTPDGEPAPGASVGFGNAQGTHPWWGYPPSPVPLDGDGDGVVAARADFFPLVVYAHASGWSLGVAHGVTTSDTDVTVTLQPGHELRGRALDPEDRPLPGLYVTVRPGRGLWGEVAPDPFARRGIVWAVTDADGRFVVRDLPAGTTGVSVHGDRVRGASRPVTLPLDEEVVLRPTAAYVLEGVVVDDAGAPVPDVSLHVDVRHSQLARPRTDSRGRFRLAWLHERATRLTAQPGVDTHAAVELDVVADEGPLRVVVPRRHPVRGRVVDEDGEPLADVRVVLSLVTARGARRFDETRTGDDGVFAFPRQDPGDYVVSAVPDTGGWAPLHLGVRPTAADETFVLRLRRGARAGGVLLDPDGRPAAGRTLVARLLDQPAEAPTWMQDRRVEVVTSATGTFVFDGLTEGRLRVALVPLADPAEDFLLANGGEVEIPAGDEDVTLRGARGVAVRGVVVDLDGNPLAGARVWLRAGREDREVTTGEDGAFLLANLPEDGPRGPPQVRRDGYTVVGITPRRLSDDEPFVITMAPAIDVVCSLVDASGEPLGGWLVEARHDEHPWRRTTRSREDGRLRIGGAPPGVLICRARPAGGGEWQPCGRFSTNVEDPLLRLGAE